MIRIDSAATIASLLKLETESRAAIRQVMGQTVALALHLASHSSAFNDRTTNLRNSMIRGQSGAWEFFVSAGDRKAPYAKFVEDNTKPHIIRPKRAKVLAFTVAGEMRFARKVNHPGTIGRHFMLDARNHAEASAAKFVEAGLNSVIR